MISFATVMVGVYMNTLLTFMLPYDGMFNIPTNQIGMQTSNLVVYSIPFTIITLCFISYAFEILGRKTTIFYSYFFTAVLYFMMPYTSPNYDQLMLVRIGIAISMAGPTAHPLVADYVHRNSRGKAVVFMGVGIVLGEIMSISLFKLTVKLDFNFYQQFILMSVIIMAESIYFYYNIKDPDLTHL